MSTVHPVKAYVQERVPAVQFLVSEVQVFPYGTVAVWYAVTPDPLLMVPHSVPVQLFGEQFPAILVILVVRIAGPFVVVEQVYPDFVAETVLQTLP